VPQDRAGRFSTELFERYQRSEQALVATLAEMYVQGVSTRKVRAITEELCGHAFSASAINKRLDASLKAFAERPLAEPFPYLILDARYEKVREAGVVMSQAVLVAIGIDLDGRRQVLGVEMANRESRSVWKDVLTTLKNRGLDGVEFVVADDHAGLRAAIREVLTQAAYQRCYVHFLRNALDHLPRKADDDCLQELIPNPAEADSPKGFPRRLGSDSTWQTQGGLPCQLRFCSGETMTPPRFGGWRGRRRTAIRPDGCSRWRRSMKAAVVAMRQRSAVSGCRLFVTGCCGSMPKALTA
jgi:hypothetical protein